MVTANYRGCVYRATNTINGKIYIGKAINGLAERKRGHERDRGRFGVFGKAIAKYGPEAFIWEELFLSDDDDVLLSVEVALIAAHKADNFTLYNKTLGGDGTSGFKYSSENRANLSAARKGMKFSEEHCRNMGKARAGKKLPGWTEERRAKMAAATARGACASTPERRAAQSAAAKRRYERAGERAKAAAGGRKGAAARWRDTV